MKKLLGALIMSLCLVTNASAETDPTVYLKGIADKMISAIEANKETLKTDDTLAKKLVVEHLLPVIDKEAFANKTLGSDTWATLNQAQQTKFIDGYINKVIDKYAKGLSLYEGQAFVFEKAEISTKTGNARVRSAMQQAGSEPLGIDYWLSKDGDKWLIFNIIVAGTDMRKSYKQQFVPRINEIGLEKFIEEIASAK